MEKFYIPTSIVYTNSSPHIGFALEVIQADVVARYRRLLGEEVLFSTGTDEHGIKNAQAAKAVGKTPADFTEEIARRVRDLAKALNLSNNEFIRTTDKGRHWPTVEKVWLKLKENGDIYKKKYEGMYCVGCEAFVVERDLVDEKCSIHKTPPEVVEEENYFFRLSKYENQLKRVIDEKEMKIIPEHRRNELLDFIDQGLEDTSCSRPREKLEWGVPVPDDETQTVYVWLEALVNYLSVVDYAVEGDKFKKFWPPDVHCIGKDIFTRFHGSLWLAILFALGVELPRAIFVHGFITVNGQKMSKTLGNVIDPFELIEKYGADAVRYFFLREIPSSEDGDFSYDKFEARYNADLAGGLGNLVARVTTLATRSISNQFSNSNFQTLIEQTRQKVSSAIESFQFNAALEAIWEIVHACDEYIDKERPWSFDSAQDKEKLEEVLGNLVFTIHNIAELLNPFLPKTSEKILKQVQEGGKEVLFPRLDRL